MILKLEIKDEHHKEILHINTKNIMGLSKHENKDIDDNLNIFYSLDLLNKNIQITEDKYYELLEMLYSNKF